MDEPFFPKKTDGELSAEDPPSVLLGTPVHCFEPFAGIQTCADSSQLALMFNHDMGLGGHSKSFGATLNTPDTDTLSVATFTIALDDRVTFYDKLIEYHARIDERAKRIRTVPGVGPITAPAIVATIGDG